MNLQELKIRKHLVTVFLFLVCSVSAYSQAKNDFDKVAITQEAKSQLSQMAAGTGELNTFASEKEIKGEFVFDMTLQSKGDVLTVFMVSSSAEDISRKNLLKDKLHTLRFENIKIPKKEKVKFRHTLIF
ncbi:MAG TPA: hypothetical protein VIT44_04530 [Cyclobacteriaceae bacterium]